MNGNELKRKIRLSVELTQEELAAIDDFRFAARSPSRAAAARELLKCGMASREPGRPAGKRQRRPASNQPDRWAWAGDSIRLCADFGRQQPSPDHRIEPPRATGGSTSCYCL